MRYSGKILAYALLAIVGPIILATGFLYYKYETYPDKLLLESGKKVELEIEKGTSWNKLLAKLEDRNVIEYSTYFDYWGRLESLPPEVKFGEYELEGNLTVEELIDKLKEGPTIEEIKVTIPEGTNLFKMADIFGRTTLTTRSRFLEFAKSPDKFETLELPDEELETLEGYLFPETYRFKEKATTKKIIRRMFSEWQHRWRKIKKQHRSSFEKVKKKYGFETHDFITLASIVQLETALHSERPIIARVFYNRLDRGMRLQTDPTCVYGEERYKKRPSPYFCKKNPNEYSTYVHNGLPPGPIGNPGQKSMEAVLTPSTKPEAKQYLFFVSKGDSRKAHYFSKTYAEHRRAINQYLK